MEKDAKIYIAGHAGMVGSAVERALRSDGYENLIVRSREALDLFNQETVYQFFETERPEYVVLSAARVGGIKANMEHPADFLYENLQIQNNVIWAAHQYNVKKLLFLGSSCIYPKNAPQPMKEGYLLDGKPEPTNEGYALAKIAGIKLCEKIYSQYDQKFISCMPTNIYGEGDNFNEESSHVIPALIRRMHEAKIKNFKDVVIWGSGETKREFLYVDDLAQAILFLMKEYEERDFVNVGTGVDIAIKELAYIIKGIVQFPGNLVFDDTKPDGMPRKLLDVEKIHQLGWRHSIELEEGVRKAYQWFQKQYGES